MVHSVQKSAWPKPNQACRFVRSENTPSGLWSILLAINTTALTPRQYVQFGMYSLFFNKVDHITFCFKSGFIKLEIGAWPVLIFRYLIDKYSVPSVLCFFFPFNDLFAVFMQLVNFCLYEACLSVRHAGRNVFSVLHSLRDRRRKRWHSWRIMMTAEPFMQFQVCGWRTLAVMLFVLHFCGSSPTVSRDMPAGGTARALWLACKS